MAAFGLIFAIASVTLAEGMKRIPAGETALLSTLETPLAPLVWMDVLCGNSCEYDVSWWRCHLVRSSRHTD